MDGPRLHGAAAEQGVEHRSEHVDGGGDEEHGLPLLDGVLQGHMGAVDGLVMQCILGNI